ncbi:glyceraldehyde-3-phosphate dehydrogenase [Methanothermus fervidus DSM 2088]|uniref:Glyceraldehyde-3-phosphate dehydrogenase n=2 Tax=Methanothermus fervidus TaxID=2180 RepID=G3P_METFE|nr:phosphorylating glyceraldehyde-3-phosphate dehydrogenase [Methanothermus fervidus]P10618.1 RecName: Full=Glyceraldehyde-3-phosphate dehydrogenase; Short=GAPDH; AltName: Full=NAD(P)-dependent glyceraldehyde-3-phosphate dehydrogenase [Methanothermus fervidus]1CF2_O Chain O, PROTEIN (GLYCERALDEHYDE-3-PHOSPHATE DEHYDROGENASE) [Methanothermus fervidus]1CF2_P Chain P, PROTEIN (GLYCERALDEHYDE-3-PHOSPHATE DEHYDROGENASE) [Methanothermus fervidus]1CF2_Q Chain Q, PROTEIN (GLYCERALDEHYDE-3-PHOSPHATE DEH
MKAVAINGYGTVGKRVADAIAQQDDMKVIGVSKTRPDFEARMALKKGYDLYVAIPERVKLFEKAGIEVAGTVDDMLDEADIVIDCTPEGIGAKNLKMYKEKGIKAIFQGGEKHEDIGLSFNSLSNYEESYGKDYTRVVSCNTTGLCRTLKPLHDSFGIKKVRAVIVRRGADPAQVSKGPINAIIPNPPKLPSHHGPDVKTVLDINIDTMAVIVPTTLMHQHNVMVEVEETPTVDDIIDVFEDTPRVILISAEDGLTSTAEIMEYAKELGRSRNDLFEIPVWRESITVVDNEIYYMQAVHQESDIVPENVDAVRAILEMEEDKYKSINKTNKAMNILQ